MALKISQFLDNVKFVLAQSSPDILVHELLSQQDRLV